MKLVATALLTVLFAINPRARQTSPIESEARALLMNFVMGRFDVAAKDFNDDLRPIVTPAVLAQVKGNLDRDVGPFRSISQARQGRADGFRMIELIAKFETASVSVRVIFDPTDRVGAVYFNPILPPKVEPALEVVARELLASMTAGNFERATSHFDVAMRQQLTLDRFSDLRKNVADLYGTFQSVSEVHQRNEAQVRVIELVAAYDKMPMAFHVTFDAQGHVAAMQVAPYYKDPAQ